jgi:mannose-6-phosphate isomerase-like protein (cupin superfamily)
MCRGLAGRTAMSSAVAVGDIKTPAHVYGVHGTTGVSYWKCLTRRLGLCASWEAVEWACIPAGGVSGAHLHTRTEELYFILTGSGQIAWDGDFQKVASGDLIVTPLGAQHELTNTGPDPLAWLVIEVSASAQAAALAGRRTPNEPTTTRHPVSLHIVNLREVGRFDATTVLDGPIRDVQLVYLPAGKSLDLDAKAAEYTMFTVRGRGKADDGTTTNALSPGVAVTLPLGTSVRAQAAHNSELELFVACLAVDDELLA